MVLFKKPKSLFIYSGRWGVADPCPFSDPAPPATLAVTTGSVAAPQQQRAGCQTRPRVPRLLPGAGTESQKGKESPPHI